MRLDELSGPDLAGVVADANAVGLKHVVIGGFSVIYHGYVRATKDSDLLVDDDLETDAAILRFLERIDAKRMRDDKTLTAADVADAAQLRVVGSHGIVDIIRGGLPPLDFATVAARAEQADWNGQPILVASLPSLVGFKRLAGRPQDKLDLAELEAIYGKLPIEPIPGLDP
jgi:hypothetical protein